MGTFATITSKGQITVPKEVRDLLGLKPMYSIRTTTHPLSSYQEAIDQAGLRIKSQQVIMEPIPPFFLEEPVVRERFLSNWGRHSDVDHYKQAEIQAVDFTLTHG